MPRFYLQDGITETDSRTLPEVRTFLDDHRHALYRADGKFIAWTANVIGECDADSWLDAREHYHYVYGS